MRDCCLRLSELLGFWMNERMNDWEWAAHSCLRDTNLGNFKSSSDQKQQYVFKRMHLCFCSSLCLRMGADVCVYINFGHFSGLSNKNMTKRKILEFLSFFFFPWIATPQDFIFLGAEVSAWNLRVSICLLITVSNLYFMFVAHLQGNRETDRDTVIKFGTSHITTFFTPLGHLLSC